MSTELSIQPTQYELSLENGKYVDKVPSPAVINKGVKCSCSNRNTIFVTRRSLLSHFETATHRTWLENQNSNQTNHLTELLQLRELNRQQKILIAERDKEIIDLKQVVRRKDTTIRELSSMVHSTLSSSSTEDVNLLDLDI